jgi:type II secretory pathway predicted ATPase ExeA
LPSAHAFPRSIQAFSIIAGCALIEFLRQAQRRAYLNKFFLMRVDPVKCGREGAAALTGRINRMYLQHFKLTEKPFQISPDPRFLWLGEKHKEAFANLLYSMIDQNGFLVLTGDVGSGKTTLLNALLENIGTDVLAATISNPRMEVLEMLRYIARSFDENARCESKTDFIIHMSRIFREAETQGRKLLLVIDEAHLLSGDQLEEIRLISNIESSQKKLITIILIGQNELNEKLSSDQCRALRQRITLYYRLQPFTSEETIAYIKHRLLIAGTSAAIFTSGAVDEIQKQTGGLPRLINVLCARALLTGYAKGMHTIKRAIIRECGMELNLPEQKFDSPPAPSSADPKKGSKRFATAALVLLAIAAMTLFGVRVLTDNPLSQLGDRSPIVMPDRKEPPGLGREASPAAAMSSPQSITGKEMSTRIGSQPNEREIPPTQGDSAGPSPAMNEKQETAWMYPKPSGSQFSRVRDVERTRKEAQPPVGRSETMRKTPVLKTAELPRPPAPSTDTGPAVLSLAQTALDKQNYRYAIEILEPYMSQQSEIPPAIKRLYAQALTGQGRLHLEASRFQEAEGNLLKAALITPDNFEVHFELGKLYTKTREYAKAVESYKSAIAAKPDSVAGLYNLGFVYATLDDHANAERILLQAGEHEAPFADQIFFNLAVVQLRLGKKGEGIENLKKSLDINPDNHRAREYLARLGD